MYFSENYYLVNYLVLSITTFFIAFSFLLCKSDKQDSAKREYYHLVMQSANCCLGEVDSSSYTHLG